MARTRRNFSAEFNAKVVLEIISGNGFGFTLEESISQECCTSI